MNESEIETERDAEAVPGASMAAMVLDETDLLADRYRIISRIGRGGMAEVYAGVHTVIGKQVAIKLLRADLLSRETVVERFLQEARSASQIRHKNIVDITDFGHSPSGRPFFVMEHLDGETLAHTIRREGAIEWPRALHIAAQLARALDAAHANGIVHRDVKPANIIRLDDPDDPDFIKVLDFGIAKIIGPDTASQIMTQEGVVVGTARYMSPEQAQSEPVDHRADIYSVGVILFEMLTGRPPFLGKGFIGTIGMHVNDPPPTFAEIHPDFEYPPGLEELVSKTLEKHPDDRWQSARELAQALDAYAAGMQLPVSASANISGSSPTPADATPQETAPGSSPEAATPPPNVVSNPVLVLVGALVLLVASWGVHRLITDVDASSYALGKDSGARAKAEAADRADADVPPPDDTTPAAAPASPPPDTPTEPTPEDAGKRDRGTLRAEFSKLDAKIRACREHGGTAGMPINVSVTIDPSGAITKALAQRKFRDTPLGACVEDVVKQAKLSEAEAEQTYTHNYKL